MEITNLTVEEKKQVLNDLLKDALATEGKSELMERIESLTTSNVDREISAWAAKTDKKW